MAAEMCQTCYSLPRTSPVSVGIDAKKPLFSICESQTSELNPKLNLASKRNYSFMAQAAGNPAAFKN